MHEDSFFSCRIIFKLYLALELLNFGFIINPFPFRLGDRLNQKRNKHMINSNERETRNQYSIFR